MLAPPVVALDTVVVVVVVVLAAREVIRGESDAAAVLEGDVGVVELIVDI